MTEPAYPIILLAAVALGLSVMAIMLGLQNRHPHVIVTENGVPCTKLAAHTWSCP